MTVRIFLKDLRNCIFKQAGALELHILTGTGHGFGMRDDNPLPVSNWITLFYDWRDARGMLKHN